MENFKFGDIFLSLILIIFYTTIIILIIKQIYRILFFGNPIIYIREKTFQKKYSKLFFFINLIIASAYLVTIIIDIKFQISKAIFYGYYDIQKSYLFLKLFLNLAPLLIMVLIGLSYLSKERITTKGIVSDKLAFNWSEVKKVEKDMGELTIHYQYNILMLNFRLAYKINDMKVADQVNRIIENHLEGSLKT